MTSPASGTILTFFWISLVLGCAGVGILLVCGSRAGQRRALSRHFFEVVRDAPAERAKGAWVERFARVHLSGDSDVELADEDARLLAQAGWRRRELYAGFPLLRGVFAALCALAFAAYASLSNLELATTSLGLRCFCVGTLGYLAPKRLLRMLAEARLRRIGEEVGPLAEILSVLFDAGLSFEQSLRVILRDGSTIVSELRLELELVMRQIAAGADRSEAFAAVMQDLALDDLTDLARLLSQIERHGGAAHQALREFCDLLDDRRRTSLQERVSKLSAKMTMVMIVFLFPALLIFIGGPGFIALKRAFEGARG